MNGKNSLRKVVCCLLILCSMIGIMEAGRLRVQAAESEEALYLEYLSKKETSIKKEMFGESWAEHKETIISGYKIMDINKDGKKELIYEFWSGGARSEGAVCNIKNGKVKELKVFGGSPQFYTVKGSKKQIVVEGAYTAFDSVYEVFLVSADGLKKKETYERSYSDSGADKVRVKKNGTEITEASFQVWMNKLTKIKLDDYKTAKKSQTVSSEKEIYLKYLAKEKKSLQKKYYETNTDVNLPEFRVYYKIIDLNGDGKKELLCTFQTYGAVGRICTIQNGKVKRLWESDVARYVDFFKLKGSKAKVIVGCIGSVVHEFIVCRVDSDKVKEIDSLAFGPIRKPGGNVESGYFRDTQENPIKDPFGKDDKNLEPIELKVF